MSREAHGFAARARTFVALGALVLVFVPGRPVAQQGSAAEGERVYAQVCLGCHAETGGGNPGVYPPLAGSEWVNGPVVRLVNILLHGISGPMMVAGEEYSGLMPAWGQSLKDDEIAAVATYIRSAWGNVSSAVTPAEVAAIREATKGRTTPWTASELLSATPGR